ncbi:abortive infection system antitoxin AbiGi family protein [Dokdonia sp. R86516]|uniref:abortive infection system antitoxin AbiGi family protein n=1 Tax=Dokdonia sp. R86516 TaxID=3093856 RepID=UPI0037C871B2
MGLSSNSLIHITKNKTSLKGILTGDFKIKYCLETMYSDSFEYVFGVPMVSFCDIPLSQVKNHIKSYGSYGIGLSRKWAIKNGLNPVLYIEKNSALAEHTFDVLYDNILDNKKVEELTEAELALADFFRYSKNYEGELIRSGKTINSEYRFSDEREWRYCPEKNVLKKNPYIIDNDAEYRKNKARYNSSVSKIRLKFEPDDITYIIIKKESEISEFVRFLEDAKGKKFSMEQVRRLTTRIITTEQIKTDF